MSSEEISDGRRVGFVLAGVQKAGTSTLFGMLSAHPEVARGKAKELHYFSDDKVDWQAPDYSVYESQIRWTETATIAGEATPSYVFRPEAMERLRAYNPDVRILLSFRDPVDRAFSAWCMLKNRYPSRPDFGQVVAAERTFRRPAARFNLGPAMSTIVSRGYYGRQLQHTLACFEVDQVLMLSYSEVFRDLPRTLDRITDFLGIARFVEPPPEDRSRAMPQSLAAVPPTGEDIARLAGLYADDLAVFAELSGLDVTTWTTSRITRGELDPADLAAELTERADLRIPSGSASQTASEPPTPLEHPTAGAAEGDPGDEQLSRADRRARRRRVRSQRRSGHDG